MPVSVNGQMISDQDIQQEFERLKPYYDEHVRPHSDEASDEQLMTWSRENLIEQSLVQQVANERPPVSAEEIDAAWDAVKDQVDPEMEQEARKDLELRIKIEQLVNSVMEGADPIDEQMCRKWYDDNLDHFEIPEQVHVRHIVKHVDGLHSKDDAYSAITEVKMRLDQGEDFNQLAVEHSDCPDEGGDLGYFPRGQMVEEFEDVVFNMEVGQISDIFLTQFGYHIARVEDKKEAGPAPFEEVCGHIASQLEEEVRQNAMETFVDQLKEKATIEETP